MDTATLVSLASLLLALLAAIYAGRAAHSTKKANQIALLQHRRRIYDSFQRISNQTILGPKNIDYKAAHELILDSDIYFNDPELHNLLMQLNDYLNGPSVGEDHEPPDFRDIERRMRQQLTT